MVGQERFKQTVQEFIEKETFPRFSIIVGEIGSGRKEAGREIARRLKCPYVIYENKVEQLRELIDLAYSQTEPIVYCIPNYEDMAPNSRGTILKVCEEVPQNAYIILTGVDRWSILDTILSRGTVFELAEYSKEELAEIAKQNQLNINSVEICQNPGDLFKFKDLDEKEFNAFINNVWDNIGYASEGNTLKITQKLKTKEDAKGYDIGLFLSGLINKIQSQITVELSKEKLVALKKIYTLVVAAKRELSLKYNKIYLVDNLLLNMREVMSGII